MKKIKKLIFPVISLPIIISPVVVSVSLKNSDKNAIHNNLTATTSNSTEIMNSQTLMDGKIIQNPENFRALEKLVPKTNQENSTAWNGTYKMPDYKKIFDAELEYYHAREYGWRSIETYENYVRSRLEITGGEQETTFASFKEHDWMAWHHAPGATLGSSYLDGVTSPIRPSWTGAELHQRPEARIDNSIPWYLYDRGAKIFAADNNNLENAFNRLKWLDRIVQTSFSEIGNESSKDGVRRNYFLVNGEFIDQSKLNPNVDYFYVKDNNSDFVRDANGWKVVIAPELLHDDQEQSKFEKVLNMVINPHPKGVSVGKTPYISNKPINGFKNITTIKDKQLAMEAKRSGHNILQEEFIEVEYPVTYTANAEYAFAGVNAQSPTANGAQIVNDSSTWSGLYRILRKSSSFDKMASDPNTYLPQEVMANDNGLVNPFGSKQSRTFTHPWNGGGYASLWVEDGHGGHKVWKNLYKKPDSSEQSLESLGVDNGEVKFFGNYLHLFPGNHKEWFRAEKDEWERFGF